MIHAPIRDCDKLKEFQSQHNIEKGACSPRKIHTKDMTYFDDFKPLKTAIRGVLLE